MVRIKHRVDQSYRSLRHECLIVSRAEDKAIAPDLPGLGRVVSLRSSYCLMLPPLSPEEHRRYSRHLSLPSFGEEAQRTLKASSVLLVGAGGLGSPLGLYLAAAGVGHLGIVDDDQVDETNLQRQVIYTMENLGHPKAEAAAQRLRALNPHLNISTYPVRFTRENARDLVRQYDVVADGADNFPTRYLVNDTCVFEQKPNVHASIFRFEGQVSVFAAEGGPCYRCLYQQPPPPELAPSCAEAGVLGVLPGLAGTLQATEVLKLLTGLGEPLVGKLLLFDTLAMRFRTLTVTQDPDCPVCGNQPSVLDLVDYEAFCNGPTPIPEITPDFYLHHREDFVLLDVREPEEYAADNLGGLLIPIGDLEARLKELTPYRERAIVVHCLSGGRAAKAVRILRNAGFANVKNLQGGLRAVRKIGIPTH